MTFPTPNSDEGLVSQASRTPPHDKAPFVGNFTWQALKSIDTLDDPARPGHLPGFRLEKGGYLLWSAGPDAKDDGGVKDKDWLWRMKQP